MPQDLTIPPKGSKYRLLTPEQFGFGRSESETTLVVDWILKEGPNAEFTPIRVHRKERHLKFGVFESYSWTDTTLIGAKDKDTITIGS